MAEAMRRMTVGRTPGTRVVYVCRVQRGLVEEVCGGNRELAMWRWPGIFGRLSWKQQVLPVEVRRLPETEWRRQLFEGLRETFREHSRMESVESMRAALGFVWGFLFRTTGRVPESLEGLHGEVRAWDDVEAWYREYRRCQRRGEAGVGRRTVPRNLFLLGIAFGQHVVPGLRLVPAAGAALGMMRGRFSLDLAERLRGVSMAPQRPTRRRFPAWEVRAHFLACGTLFEKLLLSLLYGTGMRLGALRHIARPTSGVGLTSIVTREKGGRLVTYQIGPVQRHPVAEWLRLGLGGAGGYLFGLRWDAAGPLGRQTAYGTFMAVSERACVQGVHVTPHSVRRTDFDNNVTATKCTLALPRVGCFAFVSIVCKTYMKRTKPRLHQMVPGFGDPPDRPGVHHKKHPPGEMNHPRKLSIPIRRQPHPIRRQPKSCKTMEPKKPRLPTTRPADPVELRMSAKD